MNRFTWNTAVITTLDSIICFLVLLFLLMFSQIVMLLYICLTIFFLLNQLKNGKEFSSAYTKKSRSQSENCEVSAQYNEFIYIIQEYNR